MHFAPNGARLGEVDTEPVTVLTRPLGEGCTTECAGWLAGVRHSVQAEVGLFVRAQCGRNLRAGVGEYAGDVLAEFVCAGKCVRATLFYLGWLCGGEEDRSALRAAASLELLHAFALLQDDVMDASTVRRGRPAAHRRLASWHIQQGLSGSSTRFGESAATLLGDLCLVWSEQMLRESGVPATVLARVWPRYDEMRTELAVGQLADLVNTVERAPTVSEVLDIARCKSGNYTVRRPLEMGAAMAGCNEAVLDVLGRYGRLIGEAFQLRDDLLGVFGDPSRTGKPAGDDLADHKATTVIALAYWMAEPGDRVRLQQLWREEIVGKRTVELGRALITKSGAPQRVEDMITVRVQRAQQLLDDNVLDPVITAALGEMALACTRRAH